MDNNELTVQNQDAISNNDSPKEKNKSHSSSYFFSLENRLKAAILGAALLLSLLLLFASFIILSSYIKKETKENLQSLSQFKSQQTEQYLQQFQEQIILAGKEDMLKEAFEDLSTGFSGIESDSYELPEYPGISSMSKALEDYYNSVVSPYLLSKNPGNSLPVNILPDETKARITQFLYIANNTSPLGYKSTMLKAGDGSTFSNAHQTYHPYFKKLIGSLGISDILLIDGKTGNIFYTFQKNLDFGTNIYSGPLKDSELALVCQEALANDKSDQPVFSDFSLYMPSGYKPVSFIALPIKSNSTTKGLIVFEMNATNLDQILYGINSNKINNFIKNGGNLYIIGDDFKYRTNDSRLRFQKDEFIQDLEKRKLKKNIIARIDSIGTTVQLISLPNNLFEKASLGYDDLTSFKDAAGKHVIASVSPLYTQFGNWFLIVQKNKKEVYQTANRLLLWGLLLLLLLTAVVLFFAGKFSSIISSKLKLISKNLHSTLLGIEPGNTEIISDDELGSVFNQVSDLSYRIKDASDFAIELSNGNMEVNFDPKSDDDMFANSLNKLKESLVHARLEEEKRKKEDEMRSWTTQGIAKFNDLLRHENDNIERFSYLIIKNLIEYLNANQGSVFLIEGEEGEEKLLNLVASVAWDREKYLKKQISIGEGLTGQAVLERQTIYLKEIPEDYVTIKSGLGDANPKSLLIVPMLYNEEVTGVIEIASFNEYQPFEIEFVEKIAESTAITLNSVRLNVRTKILLEESNERAEELAAQEEEMRQNLEELKATQEEMTRVKEESARKDSQRLDQQKVMLDQMKKNNEELQDKATLLEWEKLMFTKLMDSIPARITFKDTESRYIRINRAKVKALGIADQQEVMGKTDFDIFGGAHAKQALESEKQMIQSGVSVDAKEELIKFKDGRVTWGSTSRIPLADENGSIKGGLVITWDITELKNTQFRNEVSNKILMGLSSNMPVLHYSIDQKGAIVFFRGKGLKFLKLKEDDLTGKDFYKFYPELKSILESDLSEEGYSFVQHVGDHEFRHIIFANKTTNGGYSGMAFEVNASDF